jgi:phage/plasmid-associated DNA primase
MVNTFIIECNDIPKLNEVNQAIQRRLIRVNFNQSFIKKDDYNKLDEEEKKNYGIINEAYVQPAYQEEHRQALFIILSKYVNKYNANLQMPEELIKITKNYINDSDDIQEWVNEEFEFTDNIKDVIKMKDIYNTFSISNYFNNLNKTQKREYNYKWFINKLETNLELKKFVGLDIKDKTIILRKYKFKSLESTNPLDVLDV